MFTHLQKTNLFPALLFTLIIGLAACNVEDDPTQSFDNTDLPFGYSKFLSNVEVYVDGNEVVINSDGLPNHGSPYFDSSSDMYEAYTGTNASWHQNPNDISEQTLTFRIPLNPAEASNKTATPMGPIGVAINGIPLFNQYAAGGADLTGEINSFDQYNGHPQQTGQYHYHIEPLFLTAERGEEALVGYLLDGFPVYGPRENGAVIDNSDLDSYHGHFGSTPEYPDGIYHYHFTSTAPYLNGDGFFGATGTVSQ